MKRVRIGYLAASLTTAVLVALVAGALAGEAGRSSVAAGAAVAAGFQVLVFWAMTALFPQQPLLVFGVGMLGRFVLLAATALVVVPLAGWAPAPALLTLVSVLFATTLLEPLFLRPTTANEA